MDQSAYAVSVAEHAAWLCGRLGGRLQLRHARETDEAIEDARRLLSDLTAQVTDQGAEAPRQSLVEGGVLAAAISAETDLLVMGKRGAGAQDAPAMLGRHVDPVVRAAKVPVCLASKVFLPIHRVVAVMDAEPGRRAALDLVAAQSGLGDFDLDVVVAAYPGEEPDEKLALVRQTLDGRAAAFAIRAERLGAAVWDYLGARSADLIVISREVLLTAAPLRAVSPRSLWAARASVLVC
ncbi:hypothetical protein ASD38_04790 [Caulobacter sp. Root487D2Y]|nr:hypothetical protein ASD38_04790 [Caulobacter sp. Root487D2Y]